MYQALERKTLLYLLLAIGGLVLIGMSFLIRPATLLDWLRTASATLTTSAILVGVLGASPLWRIIWRFVPALNDLVFPDLSGQWKVVLHSNIEQIAQRHPDLKRKKIDAVIQASAQIRQNWFAINIAVDSDSRYSSSDTICVCLERSTENRRRYLVYTYKNLTPKPLETDEQLHFGSARLEIIKQDDTYVLEGVYWTNRNWTKAMNTAGTIKLSKL